MDSRLLTALNATASSTRDPVLWARTVCRAASHFASHGMSAEALKSIGVVRAHYGTELHHEVASWLMLAEGVLHYSQARTYEAYDRIRRAYGLAVSLQTEAAIPVCAAWMALVEFHDCAYDKMIIHLEEALAMAAPTDYAAHARASLVLADAFHVVNEYKLARPWYEKARLRAVDDGDNAMLSAMFHNVAVFRVSNIRLDDCFGIDVEKEVRSAALEMASSMHYDHAIGSKGLEFLSQMLRGLVFVIQKKYDDALIAFNQINLKIIKKNMFSSIYADMAWCHVNTGSLEDATRFARLASETQVDVSEADDRAYISARLSQVASVLGERENSLVLMDAAKKSLLEHRTFQADLLKKLKAMKI